MKNCLLPILVLFVFVSSLCHAQNPCLWGLAPLGGTNYAGVLFNYNTTTGVESVVHDFGSGSDGQNPYGSLIQAKNGLLYGVTYLGGADSGGVIFSYTISTDSYTVLYNFSKDTGGYNPFGSLIQAINGLLYGTALNGGADSGGALFSYNISTGGYTDLHDFGSGTDGQNPCSPPLQVYNGLLYGVTNNGGANAAGILYSYDITTDTEIDLHDFGTAGAPYYDGKNPFGALIQGSDSLLYGMTLNGGKTMGEIFSWNITTSLGADVHDFDIDSDGYSPYGKLLQLHNGLLYGLTLSGGTANNGGTLFVCNGSTGDETILYSFGNTRAGPIGSPIQASDSLLYGTVVGGGAGGIYNSQLFSYNFSTGKENYIYTFPNSGDPGAGVDGKDPYGDLLEVDPVQVTPLNQTICTGNNLTLIASGASTYSWSPSTGLSATTGDSVVANPTIPTIYSVTGTGPGGWTATTTDIVSIVPSPNKPTFIQHGDTLISSSKHDNQWYRNDTLLTGDTSQDLIITSLGDYWVLVNNEANGCSTSSDSIKVDSVTGINQLSVESGQLTVYPNPTSGQFTIKTNGNQNGCMMEIYNLMGEKIYESVLSDSQNSIDLSSQAVGLYFVYLKSDEGVEVGKVLVTR